MSEIPKTDVRAAIEWAWLEFENCVVRGADGKPKSLDFEKRSCDAPPGGQQMLNLAFTNPTGFQKDFVLKVLGGDLDDESDDVVADKKSIAELRKIIKQFQEKKRKMKKSV